MSRLKGSVNDLFTLSLINPQSGNASASITKIRENILPSCNNDSEKSLERSMRIVGRIYILPRCIIPLDIDKIPRSVLLFLSIVFTTYAGFSGVYVFFDII